jgi:hypothetical protein
LQQQQNKLKVNQISNSTTEIPKVFDLNVLALEREKVVHNRLKTKFEEYQSKFFIFK